MIIQWVNHVISFSLPLFFFFSLFFPLFFSFFVFVCCCFISFSFFFHFFSLFFLYFFCFFPFFEINLYCQACVTHITLIYKRERRLAAKKKIELLSDVLSVLCLSRVSTQKNKNLNRHIQRPYLRYQKRAHINP